MSPASAGPRGRIVCLSFALAGLLLLGGCAVNWIAGYDAQPTERITALSKSTLGLYQELLAEASERGKVAAAVAKQGTSGPDPVRSHVLTSPVRL